MTPDRDDLLEEIGEALAVEPRAGFEAQVLTRIEVEARTRTSWSWWAAAATATGAVVIAVLVVLPSRPEVDRVGPTAGQSIGSVASTREDLPSSSGSAAAASASQPRIEGSPGVVAPAQVTSTQVISGSRRVAAPSERQYEVIVPPDQVALWRRFLADLREGRVILPPENSNLGEPLVVHALQDLTPVEIPPIRLDPLEPSETPLDLPAESVGS